MPASSFDASVFDATLDTALNTTLDAIPEHIVPGATAPLRVLVADDHAIVRDGLKLLIDSQPDMEVVAAVPDGYIAVDLALHLRPDVVVMDIVMPILPGPPATRQIKQRLPEVKVLALTLHEERSYLGEMLEAGASGYMLKRSATDELMHAIRTIARGGVYMDPVFAHHVVRELLNEPKNDGLWDDTRDGDNTGRGDDTEFNQSNQSNRKLSERETRVLRLIASGYSNKEIAQQLDLSAKTTATYKRRAMEKLRLGNRAAIMRHAMRQGWLDDTDGIGDTSDHTSDDIDRDAQGGEASGDR